MVLAVLGLSFLLVHESPIAQKLTVGMWVVAYLAAGLILTFTKSDALQKVLSKG